LKLISQVIATVYILQNFDTACEKYITIEVYLGVGSLL